MEVANVYVDYKLSVEEGTSFFKVFAQCFIFEDFKDEPIQIGEACLHLFNPLNSTFVDLWGEANRLSEKLSYSLKNLEKFCDLDKINGTIAVFHTLKLEDSWDSKDLGTAVFNKIEEELSLLNVEWIVISNSKNQASVDSTARLSLYINDLGFKSFKEDKGPVIMFKKICRTYVSV